MEEFQDLINWSLASRYQIMSESFVNAFKNKVDWDKIDKYQASNFDFVAKMRSSALDELVEWSE